MIYTTYHPVMECEKCYLYSAHVNFHQRSSHETSTASEQGFNQPRTIAEAVALGRRMQFEEDSTIFSRYRSKLDSLRRKREQESLLGQRYCYEADLMRVELAEAKDKLLALQIAYEELLLSRETVGARSSPAIGNNAVPLSTSEELPTLHDDEDQFDVLQQVQLMDQLNGDAVMSELGSVSIHYSRLVSSNSQFIQ